MDPSGEAGNAVVTERVPRPQSPALKPGLPPAPMRTTTPSPTLQLHFKDSIPHTPSWNSFIPVVSEPLPRSRLQPQSKFPHPCPPTATRPLCCHMSYFVREKENLIMTQNSSAEPRSKFKFPRRGQDCHHDLRASHTCWEGVPPATASL